MSVFNPEQFAQTQFKGEIDTKIIPIPAGDYRGQISKWELKKINTKEGERGILELTWDILDEAVKKATGFNKPSSRQGIFLDLTADGKSLDFSKDSEGRQKNRSLGVVLEAVGIDPAKGWRFQQLQDKLATVKVTHRPNENDPDAPPYSEIKKVAKLKA